MSYLQKTLLKDEKIIFLTHPCQIIFAYPITIIGFALLVYFFGADLFNINIHFFKISMYSLAAAAIAISGLYNFLNSLINYNYSEYGVTNKRVLMKRGLIQRDSFEIFLDKIEAVHVDQTLVGRLFDYGSVIIVGTGGSADPFLDLPNPLRFRNLIQQAIDDQLHLKQQ